MRITEDIYLIGLTAIPQVSSKVEKLIAEYGSPKAAWLAGGESYRQELSILLGRSADLVSASGEDLLLELVGELDKRKISWLSQKSGLFPANLKEITLSPSLIFFKGELIENFKEAVAIVGARRASAYGKAIAFEIAKELSVAGVTIISGLARGIDSSAHLGALEGRGGTIAVLGCGHEVIYPPENKNLYKRIAEEGSIVSEYFYNTPPLKWNFPARNRLISALARGVVVVEATEKSGAMLTVDFALEQNREVFAVPGSVKSPLSRGPHHLLKSGACLVESAADIIEVLGLEVLKKESFELKLTLGELMILDIMGYEPKHIDEIILKADLSLQETVSILTKLEIIGHIKQDLGKNYIRII